MGESAFVCCVFLFVQTTDSLVFHIRRLQSIGVSVQRTRKNKAENVLQVSLRYIDKLIA